MESTKTCSASWRCSFSSTGCGGMQIMFWGKLSLKGPPPYPHRCHNHIQIPRSLGWPCFKLVHIRKNVVTQLSRNTIDSKQETTAALYSFKEQSLEAVLTYVDSFWCFYIPACFGRIALWWKTRARSDRRAPLESMQIVWSFYGWTLSGMMKVSGWAVVQAGVVSEEMSSSK